MSQITTPVVIVSLATLILAGPIADNQNQRNPVFSAIGHSNTHVNGVRMRPILKPLQLRDRTRFHCPKAGFFVNPNNCSHFYRCVDVADTGFFSIFNFECPTAQVFSEETANCIPGTCPFPSLSITQVTQPVTEASPAPPSQTPPRDPDISLDLVTYPPAPPPPPSPPLPSPQPTEVTQGSQMPQWMNELPPWFKETPWWFKTPPAWFNQPPAWFNAPPAAHVIEEEIYIDDSEPVGSHIHVGSAGYPSNVVKEINKSGNITLDGVNNSFLHDNKTIRIHIPIHIIQQ